MESWILSKHKAWLFGFFICITMLPIFMVGQIQGVCIEEERKALLEIKASLNDFCYTYDVCINLLPTWVDHGNTSGSECCDWERVKCNTTTKHVTDLSLGNLMDQPTYFWDEIYEDDRIWPLNVSFFLHFKELRSLDLSFNHIDDTILSTGLERLSSLKRLETFNLSCNGIGSGLFSSLGSVTSLKILDLSYTVTGQAGHQNGCKNLSRLKRLENILLRGTHLDKGVISCLSFLPSLKSLDLRDSNSTNLGNSFPMQEFRELEALDLSSCGLQSLTTNGTINNKLVQLKLDWNSFKENIMRPMAAFPSLRILSLDYSMHVEIPLELPNLPDLEFLSLRSNNFNGTLPIQALASSHHLEVLDLSDNHFVGSIPSAIRSLSSLRAISFANNFALNGSLPESGFCDFKNLHELDLRNNMFSGSLPECFNRLSSLKLLDISNNLFTGTLPPSLIANLTSLEYVDFSHNRFEGSISFSLFSNHTNLEVVAFASDNNKFAVKTEEPKGWIPTFQLKALVLSNCNIKGSGVPSFLLLQHELQMLDMSHNSLVGHFPNWLIKNNSMLQFLSLRNNSFDGSISMPSLSRNYQMEWLDMSGNLVRGTIPSDIQKLFPRISHLNMSRNSLDGVIPSSVGDLRGLRVLDLSHNQLSGEVPTGLCTNLSMLWLLKLSNNSLQGEVLSRNLSWGNLIMLQLDNNLFTGKIGSATGYNNNMDLLDISDNSFSGIIPNWIVNSSSSSSSSSLTDLLVRNNRLEGRFPCGTALFSFLDISNNGFSGPIPSCLNWQNVTQLHLGSNRFTGSVPASFGDLTSVLTLDIENNSLSGGIPEVLGELSDLRILLLGKNKFSGSIPKQLCQLRYASLIDLSSNSLSGSIPPCLENINAGPNYPAFIWSSHYGFGGPSSVDSSSSVLDKRFDPLNDDEFMPDTEDIAVFTIKSMPRPYKGYVLNIMAGLDLSCNKLTGEIPPELGMLNKIHVLNLSHNQLTGPIPVSFSNLSNIESMDLSSNRLSGKVPSELTKLNFLEVFDVSNNNLSGRLPDVKAQFGTFPSASYEGNPFLCGPPLEKRCTTTTESPMIVPPAEDDTEKWYDIDRASFYGTWIVFMLGFAAILYTNPHWRQRWLDFVEECMYKCYYFLYDLVRKPRMLFRN